MYQEMNQFIDVFNTPTMHSFEGIKDVVNVEDEEKRRQW
jgi:hypothetical protein